MRFSLSRHERSGGGRPLHRFAVPLPRFAGEDWWRRLAFLLLALLAATAAPAGPVVTRSLDHGWSFRLHPGDGAIAAHGEDAAWSRATVPGVVQTDLLAAGRIPDPFVGLNEAGLQWIGLADWDYRTTLTITAAESARDHLDLVFDGLDTFAQVRVNGVALLAADNQHRRWRVGAKGVLHAGDNALEVFFASPIKRLQPEVLAKPYVLPGAYDSAFGDEPAGKQTSSYLRKSPYHYGWDWGPRYVTQGLWRDVRLEAWDDVRLEAMRVLQDYIHPKAARIFAELDVVADRDARATIEVRATGPGGAPLPAVRRNVDLVAGVNHVSVPVEIAAPRRWWPAGYGAQDLYRVAARIEQGGRTIAAAERRVGLRSVELRRQPDAWGKSFAFVVNGVPIFAKGANLIPFDSFAPRVTDAQMRATLQSAKNANMNMLRMWGGGHYQSDAFYTMADEMGLMIWQEFMFGGAIPPYDVAFRENTRVEAAEQVRRIGDHPSVVLWSGNNEVQTGWENWPDRVAFKDSISGTEREKLVTGMTVLFGQVLRDAVTTYAPGTPYVAGSPGTDYDGPADQDGDGDRHYWAVWGGSPVEDYLKVTPRFMSEYGLQSMPEMRTILSFARPEDLSVTSPVMRAHQKYASGNGNDRLLLYIRRNYGEPRDFASFVYLSQVMQAEGIELAATHLRAARPRSMGSLYWQLNDVWPGASWSSVDHFGRWKALQFHARRFYAPVIVSAIHDAGATTAEVVSDRTTAFDARWRLRVMDVDGRVLHERSGEVTAAPLASTRVETIGDAAMLQGADPRRTFGVYELIERGAVIARSLVYFDAAKRLALPDPGLTATIAPTAGGFAVTVEATRLARAVWVDLGADATLSDNAFDLLPGERVTLKATSVSDLATLSRGLSVRSLYGATTAGAP